MVTTHYYFECSLDVFEFYRFFSCLSFRIGRKEFTRPDHQRTRGLVNNKKNNNNNNVCLNPDQYLCPCT